MPPRYECAGYHVTEIKRHNINSMDCGARTDSWKEISIQLLDLDGDTEKQMTLGKFLKILGAANLDSRGFMSGAVQFEIGKPGEALQVFDLDSVEQSETEIIAQLKPREAICKPAHSANLTSALSIAKCCGSSGTASSCCAA